LTREKITLFVKTDKSEKKTKSLLRFAQKISKNRRLGGAYEAILPCTLPLTQLRKNSDS
jgi:hypothetical protein